MKILKIFGVVVGIHAFALILIFANPGCSSARKPTRDVSQTVIADGGDSLAMPAPVQPAQDSPVSAAPVAPPSFDPDAPATAGVRFSPTRPGTPAASALEAAPVADVTPATTYTVVKGDSLWTIAKRHGSSVAEIAAANNIKANATVRVGQRLIIPSKPVASSSVQIEPSDVATRAAVAPAAPRSSGQPVLHVVRPGETLGAIARKYQVRVGDIATANNIADPARILPGMELTIPGWQAPASRSTRASAPRETAQPPAPAPESPAPQTDAVPTLIIPAPEQDLDSGLRNKDGEPPVIQVQEQ